MKRSFSIWLQTGLLAMLLLPACAVQQQQAADSQATTSLRQASYRVELSNRTGQPVRYRYVRYQPPEALRAADPNDMEHPQTLDISFSFNDLAPGGVAVLEAIPGSHLVVQYQTPDGEQRVERPLTGPTQLIIDAAGLSEQPR